MNKLNSFYLVAVIRGNSTNKHQVLVLLTLISNFDMFHVDHHMSPSEFFA